MIQFTNLSHQDYPASVASVAVDLPLVYAAQHTETRVAATMLRRVSRTDGCDVRVSVGRGMCGILYFGGGDVRQPVRLFGVLHRQKLNKKLFAEMEKIWYLKSM